MIDLGYAVIALACLSGLALLPGWWKKSTPSDRANAVHGFSAAAFLVLMLINLDNNSEQTQWLLIVGFLSIATGMLLFLYRQRQRSFNRLLLLGHAVFGIALIGAWAIHHS